MPATQMSQDFELETRNRYTKVNTELTIKVDGRELPNMAVLGSVLEECIELIRTKIRQSYEVVPPRVDTPIAEPYGKK